LLPGGTRQKVTADEHTVKLLSVNRRASRKQFLISLFTAGSLMLGWQMAHAQTPAPKAKEQTPAVLICGTGISPHYENIVNELLDSLKEQAVSAKLCEGHDFTRSTSLEKAKEVGASSVLYVSVYVSDKYAYETKLSVQCINADGTKLWEENQKGPLMSGSVSSTVNKITEKMKKKLQAHVGKPGLPTSKGNIKAH
jgi:hypothetical protein